MPKKPLRTREKHVKSHEQGREKEQEGDTDPEGVEEQPDNGPDLPPQQAESVEQPPRLASAASMPSVAELVALYFCDDTLSSPDRSIASPLFSENSMDPLSLQLPDDSHPCQLQGPVTPESLTFDFSYTSSDFISPPPSPFKIPLVDTGRESTSSPSGQ